MDWSESCVGKQTLNYLPLSYHHRHSAWIAVSILGLAFGGGGMFVLLGLFGIAALPIGLIALTLLAVYIARTISTGNWESRVEGDSLACRGPNSTGWVEIRLAEISELNCITYSHSDRWPACELVMLDGKRKFLDHRMIGNFESFAKAIHRANSEVRFGRRDGDLCHACGADLRVRKDRCPGCLEPIPRTITG